MKCLIAVLATLVISLPAFAGTSWEVQVVYPDKESKTFIPSDEEMAVPVKLKNWTCKLAASALTEGRVLRCISSNGIVRIVAGCKYVPNAFSMMSIETERGTTTLTLECKAY